MRSLDWCLLDRYTSFHITFDTTIYEQSIKSWAEAFWKYQSCLTSVISITH
jgi:FPC/CPF motif-containing protein YcgG